MKIEMTVTPEYVKWGLWEGIRELIQNWKDADAKGNKGSLSYNEKTGILRLKNLGANIPRKALLLGFSDKRNAKGQIGQFGEGLKLGCLGLVKAGYNVRIRTGRETWKPMLTTSQKFPGQTVLAFDIRNGKKEAGMTEIIVERIAKEDWDQVKDLFLFLSDLSNERVIETSGGKILIDRPGDIYVKGIFVTKNDDMTCGYDINAKITDRDRGMVNSFDLQWQTSSMWKEAIQKHPGEVTKKVFEMLQHDKQDVAYMDNISYQDDKAVEAVVEAFEQEHGKDAVPARDLDEAKQMQFLGQKSVVVGESLKKIVEKKKGSIELKKRQLENAVVKRYSPDEINEAEWANLNKTIELVQLAIPEISLKNVEVVEFGAENLRGRYENGKALIRKSELASLQTCLFVGIHEWSHAAGGDGSKDFEDRLVDVSVRIILGLTVATEEKV